MCLGFVVGRLPLLRRHRRVASLWLNRGLLCRCIFAGELGAAADRPEGLAFGTLDLGGIGAAPALEVEVLADRVVE